MRDKTILLFSAILFLTLLPGIRHGIWRPDEPQVAGICAEMAYQKDFVVPRLNGQPFLEKPPFYYALGAMLGTFFGEDNDLAYRLASIFFAGLTLFITFRMVSLRGGTMSGLLASGVLASSWGFFRLARWIQVDMSLVFSVTLAMYAYMRLSEKSMRRHSMLMGLGIGFSFMAKGLVGPAIIATAVVADIILKRDLSIIRKIGPLWILAIMFIPALPWILALYGRGGLPFLREVIVVNNLMRFTGAPEGAALGHMHGPLFYLKVLPLDFLPWTFAFVPALVSSLRKPKDNPYLGWFIGPFLLLSIASAKRDVYLIPLYPACACMTALWLSRAVKLRWGGAYREDDMGNRRARGFCAVCWNIFREACARRHFRTLIPRKPLYPIELEGKRRPRACHGYVHLFVHCHNRLLWRHEREKGLSGVYQGCFTKGEGIRDHRTGAG